MKEKNMNKYSQAGPWIVILVVLVLGLVTMQVGFSLIDSQTTSTTITDDTFTASNITCVDVTDKCILALSSVENASDGVVLGVANYSLCSANAGSVRYYDGILLDDTLYNGNSLNATYTEVDCNHVSGITSLVIKNIPILLAVALLVFASGFVLMKK